MKIIIDKGIPQDIATTISYVRLKHMLFDDIISFCREKIELKQDLLALREGVGSEYSLDEIKNVIEILAEKYNSIDDRIGIDWHIEKTRYDYALIVFVIIQRAEISAKTFVFRYKKTEMQGDIMTFINDNKQDKN